MRGHWPRRGSQEVLECCLSGVTSISGLAAILILERFLQ